MVSVQLRIRAPGAKTFLQVIRARYGTTTHKVFVFYALLTNIIVTANAMLGKAIVVYCIITELALFTMWYTKKPYTRCHFNINLKHTLETDLSPSKDRHITFPKLSSSKVSTKWQLA